MPLRVGPLSGVPVIDMPDNPIKLSAAAPKAYGSPPSLGEHTRRVLGDWVGYSDAKLDALRQAGTIA